MYSTVFRKAVCFLLLICLLAPCFSVRASGAQEPPSGFRDVPQDAWYREAVEYTVSMGYFSGVGNGLFAPSGTMTRAMMTTVLWRIAGSPEPTGPAPFTDVKPTRYYAKPAAWAYENGIISGTAEGLFSPDAKLTRQQMAVILRRFADARGCETTGGAEGVRSFPDREKVSPYAVEAVGWAVQNYFLRGRARKGISWLNPKEKLTRAEAAVIIHRFDQQILQGIPTEPEAPEEAEEPEQHLTLWIEGCALPDCPVWAEPYAEASALAAALEGTADTEENICLEFGGHRAFLSKKNENLLFDGAAGSLPSACRYYNGGWYVPASFLTEFCCLDSLSDAERQQIFYSRVLKNQDVPVGKRVVILRYHCVSDEIWGSEEAFVSPSVLEAQIVRMKELGCTFLTFEDLGRVDEYELPVLLTFDDGYRDNYTELFPILQRQNVKATVFMITKYIGGSRSLNAEQIKEMSDSGLVSIQSHTQKHKDLTTFTEEELRADFEIAQLSLARITGKIPFVLCYPKGKRSELVETVAADYYEFGILANTAPWITGTNPFAVSRFGIHRSTTEEEWTGFLVP